MCELFAMSSRDPANLRFSLEAFSRRGGLGGANKDGWGIAWYVDEDVRLVKEPEPAAESACVRFIQDHPFAATIALSHIRKATQGRSVMKNCQPFVRELGGRTHVFAHNGNLDIAALRARMSLEVFHPVGETDSEYAFCALLERLRAVWRDGAIPGLDARRGIVERFAAEIRPLGPANFIYSDGDAVFMHGHRRMHAGHREPMPPGLYQLCRRCAAQSDLAGVHAEGLTISASGGGVQEVVLAASVPLTDEPGWRALAEGELVVARLGRIA
ncbi:MAG: class II glutamine amidotransferase [Betaproteobacteria bacterium]|nr:class II glutamine amidotransferase [Betaproteobacteria bacterium]